MNSRRQRIVRGLRKLVFVSGCSTLGVLSTCDPTVADTVLTGLQDLSTALIDAFFQAITPQVDAPTVSDPNPTI